MSSRRAIYRHFRYISPCGQAQGREASSLSEKKYTIHLSMSLRKPRQAIARFGHTIALSLLNFIFIDQTSIMTPPKGFQVTSFAWKKINRRQTRRFSDEDRMAFAI
jgi:hypothetical protein